MQLETLGFNQDFANFHKENNLSQFIIGRIISEHKERYVAMTENDEFDAEITGNMRFSAQCREDFPAVGDWVAMTAFEENFSIIHKILPRFSVLSRQAPGQFGNIQIIAANIDFAFIIQSVDRDFNLNRIDRYLTICHASKVNPIIILTKIDLINAQILDSLISDIKKRQSDIPVLALSSVTENGISNLKRMIIPGKTYCMLGSSGVGKSTLLNVLYEKNHMKTDTISETTNKGKHVTSHRELVVLSGGGIIIDNPGMREVGIVDSADGLESTYERITELAQNCKFQDCTHTSEISCAVLNALENGQISQDAYENYLRLLREKNYFNSTIEERRKKEKQLSKILKDYNKKNIKNKK